MLALRASLTAITFPALARRSMEKFCAPRICCSRAISSAWAHLGLNICWCRMLAQLLCPCYLCRQLRAPSGGRCLSYVCPASRNNQGGGQGWVPGPYPIRLRSPLRSRVGAGLVPALVTTTRHGRARALTGLAARAPDRGNTPSGFRAFASFAATGGD